MFVFSHFTGRLKTCIIIIIIRKLCQSQIGRIWGLRQGPLRVRKGISDVETIKPSVPKGIPNEPYSLVYVCVYTHLFPTGMKRWHSCQQRFTDGKYRWHLPARWNARHVFLTGASLRRARISPQSLLRSHRGEDPRPRLTSQQNKTAVRRRMYSRWYHIIDVLAIRAHTCSSVVRSHNTRTHETKPYREPKTLRASHAKGVKSL